MTTPSASPAPNASSIQHWWQAMIRRELMLKGQPEAAAGVDSLLRATPEDPDAVPGGGRETVRLFSSLGEIVVRLNAVTSEPIAWLIERLAEGGDASAPEEELVQLATEAADPPADAERVVAEYENIGDNVVFRVRWVHMWGGLPVEGDFIEVFINARHRKVFKLSRRWHEPEVDGEATWR